MKEKYEPQFLINECMVQGEAESCLERELSKKEIADVFESICEESMEFIQDRIRYVVDFNEILKRNKKAKNELVHFDVYHRNQNAYQPEFELRYSLKTEAEAIECARHYFITEDDEWKVVRYEGADEKIVWSINLK